MGALASDFVNQKNAPEILLKQTEEPDQRPPRQTPAAWWSNGATLLRGSNRCCVGPAHRLAPVHASYTQKSSTYHTPSCRARCRSKMNVKPPLPRPARR